jgi:hypothetical protein
LHEYVVDRQRHLRVSGFNREESLRFDEPADVMARFEQ